MKPQFRNPMKGAKLFRYPQGDITQLFGENPELYQKHLKLRIIAHNGIDVVKPYGYPILAVCGGYIASIKDSPDGYGRHIRLISEKQDDGFYYEITYGHLATIEAKLGYWVSAGDIIGTCGNSGFVVSGSTPYWYGYNPDNRGTHLHLGIRKLSEVQEEGSAFLQYIDDKYSYHVLNYKNGYCGAIDPMPFFEDEIKEQAMLVIELAKQIIAQVIAWIKRHS